MSGGSEKSSTTSETMQEGITSHQTKHDRGPFKRHTKDSLKLFEKHYFNTLTDQVMCNLTLDDKLGLKLMNRGRKNMNDWLERIIEYYISEQAIEDQTSLDKLKENFYIELHDVFFALF